MLKVAAAIIEDEEGRLLIARRKPGKSQAGLWEFPGGKLEPGESPAECLRRELREEMAIDIAPYESFGENVHDYGNVTICLIAWRAKWRPGTIRLTDHDEYRWARPSELASFEWAPADIPFVDKLVRETVG
ncbi:(deoxy)nucleoside triphosphate pyrophosphohydrolase [Cohnella thailandensis]|uniref:8-oxo-dGTP diphosphatase n=1 Tax=Cohnella thailandensis TaxID=557557 RepID=A0A841SZT8_9BACL|nr:(deoxy)nucleoside triphosphate pyrophosphohydrolase [Cohnella thailandensis]MBB6637703.1 (deoxy)nucleoside triphosphate pyrophosphohydrolase [Cohnella thailandensis]MBP1974120.1 8-oxo-dGTP diphosphatase [Cohnella thailandensis]